MNKQTKSSSQLFQKPMLSLLIVATGNDSVMGF
jgi:hypothetical protein